MPEKKKPAKGGLPRAEIGVIGGSGIYRLDGLRARREVTVKTPFGAPSGAFTLGELDGTRVAFLPRHGQGHLLNPSELPQRANIWAFKALGVKTLLSVSAVGSLKEELAPGCFVFPDQLVDRTAGRPGTFFDRGVVAHVDFSRPFCDSLSDRLYSLAETLGIACRRGGTLVCMEGPAFSTKAESEFHRRMGYSLIGMTACPEAKLAREAGLCYAPISMVTDYDVWKENEQVTAGKVLEIMSRNSEQAGKLLARAIPEIAKTHTGCACRAALKGASPTDRKLIPAAAKKRLALFLGELQA
ncbi:MAG: S-methyl-5'-thioadenosine phosphorylase [Elusimicrobiaceae bacterium]|nr:S-methyl-5'-thioadenosine phosphorylase [Elusimicrobiaceae bacterium]